MYFAACEASCELAERAAWTFVGSSGCGGFPKIREFFWVRLIRILVDCGVNRGP